MGTVQTFIKIKKDPASEKAIKDTETDLKRFAMGTAGAFESLKSAGIAGAGIAIGITAIAGAFRLVSQAAQEAVRLIDEVSTRGGEVAGAARAFNDMASPGLISRLTEANRGLATQTDIMEAHAVAARKGLTDAQIAQLMSASADAARGMGRDITEAMDAAVGSVTRSNFNETLRGLRQNIIAVGDGSVSASESIAAMGVQISNAYDQFANSFGSNSEIIGFFDDLGAALEQSGVDWAAMGNAIAAVTASVLRSVAGMFSTLGTGFRDFFAGWRDALDFLGLDDASDAADQMTTLSEGMRAVGLQMEALASARDRASASAPDMTITLAESLADAGGDSAGERRRRGAGGGSGPSAEERRTRELELQGQMHQANINLIEKELTRTESLRELDREIAEFDLSQLNLQRDIREALHAKEMENIREESDLRKAMIAAEEEMRQQRFDRATGLTEQAAGGAQLISDTLGQIADYQQEQVDRQVEAMTAANEAHIAGLRAAGATEAEIQSAVVKGNAEIAAASQAQVKSIDNLRKAEGAFLIAYNAVMAAVEVAKAIAAFGSQKYVEGAAHVLAAAAYGVAAGMAAAKLGGGSAGSTPTVSAGTFTPAKKPVADTSKGDGAGVTINNVYSLGPSEAGVGRALEQAQWTRTKRGVSTGSGLGVEYDA